MADEATPKKLAAFYGEDFPGFEEQDGKKWRAWLDAQWDRQQKAMRSKRLHYSRHRNFRQGRQWISTRDGRTWSEPRHDKNTIRSTINIIGPSLDYRLGVLQEQKPGFRYEPLGTTLEAKEQAESQQVTVEYYFHTLRAWVVMKDALQAAQTDGVAFLHVFKDKTAGPTQKRVKLITPNDQRYAALEALGYQKSPDGNISLPLAEDGTELNAGETAFEFHEGDIAHRVVYAHETIADPEAKTVNGPYDKAKWMIIRRIRDLESARIETDNPKLESEVDGKDTDPLDDTPDVTSQQWMRGLPIFPTTRRDKQSGVYEYLVFFNGAVAKEIKQGAWRRIIANKIISGEDKLPGGKIPLARFGDGSADPDLYKRPMMSDWIGDQMTINALVSMAVMHARVFGGGRMMVQADTVIEESFSSIIGSMIEYSGLTPQAAPTPRLSGDVWKMIDWHVKKLDDKTGWNDFARGQIGGSGSMQDISGRALLGARELFERTLGPMVRDAAEGATEWSDLIVIYAKELFQTPRLIPVMGGRADLAKRISAEGLGDENMVYADPETLMPQPRVTRNQMLFDFYEKGMISLHEYKSRAPFGFIRDAHSGEQSHWIRAQVVNEVLTENWQKLEQMQQQDPISLFVPENGVPVLWTDEPEPHMNALSELILDDRKPWGLRKIAMTLHNVYEDLEKAKNAGTIDEATGQPLPPAPVPMEVIGAPADIPRSPAVQPPQEPQAGGGGGMPGGGQLVSPTPEMSSAPSEAAGMEAQPLGTFGAGEEALAGTPALPR